MLMSHVLHFKAYLNASSSLAHLSNFELVNGFQPHVEPAWSSPSTAIIGMSTALGAVGLSRLVSVGHLLDKDRFTLVHL